MSKIFYSFIILFCFVTMQCKTKARQSEKLAKDAVESAAIDAANAANSGAEEVKDNDEEVKYARVKFIVTYSEPYCGGAQPSEEIIRELRTPKPYKNFSMYIRSGKLDYKKEIFQELKTDEHGVVNVKLPYGEYNIVSEKKKDSDVYQNYLNLYSKETSNTTAIDVECLQKYMNTPDSKFVIKGDETIEIHYNKQCFYNEIPCVDYTGPLPQ